MISSKNIVKLSLHLLGWGVLLLLVLLQNDLSDWNDEDYFLFANVLVCIGIVAYINLYFLIPRYLFAKKYAHYTGFLFVLVFLTASLITWIINDLNLDSIDWSSRFVVTLIALTALALLTSGGKLLVEYLRKMMKFKEIENKQLKDELALLKEQIQPHFLFNTLNNLYGLITQDQNQKAAVSDGLIAPLLFIPLVENAFKHVLNTITADSFAYFSLSVQGKDLFFEAKNSLGKSLEKSPESGTGIANLRKRLQLIYPNNHLLDIQKSNDEYKVILHIQL